MDFMFNYAISMLIVASYLGIVLGTYNKLKYNGIHLKGNVKMFFVFVPFCLFLFHLAWALVSLRHSPKKSFSIMYVFIFKYPIIIGVLVELILEEIAYNITEDPEIININKKRAIKKQVAKKKFTDIETVPNSIWKDYRSTLKELALQTS